MLRNTTKTEPRDVDLYPSRIFDVPRIMQRHDPVVHGEIAAGPLDATQLAAYEAKGYLSIDALLSAEEMVVYLEALEKLRSNDLVKSMPEAIVEPQSRDLRSVFAVHKTNPALAQLCTHPKIVAIARQLLGDQVYIHQSRINYKPGFRGKEFYWHSDFETWHVEDGIPRMRMVSCSISLTSNTACNGPLMIIPGSHHEYISCVGATPQDNYQQSLKRQEVGVPDDVSLADLVERHGIDTMLGAAGSVTFFECNVMHGSNSNITPLARSNVFVVYNSVSNTPLQPFCGLAPRPPFIAERADFAPVGAN
jgi:ectoine hydroxylase